MSIQYDVHVCAWLEIRTGCLAYRKGAQNANKMQPCWLDNAYEANIVHRCRFFEQMTYVEKKA